MPVRISKKHGYIIGGSCDQAHRDRAARERGGKAAVAWLENNRSLRHVGGGWWRLTRRETKAERALDWRAREAIVRGNACAKVGCYRVFQDVLPLFRKQGKAFRLAFFMKCVDDVEGFEFGVAAQTPLGPFDFGYCKPHRDAMYQARKDAGDFETKRARDANH